jgi:hypothetical protein
VISNRNANNSKFLIGAKDMLKDALTIFTIFINIVNKFWGNGMSGFHCFRIFYWKKGIQKRTKINVQNRPRPTLMKNAKTAKTPSRP